MDKSSLNSLTGGVGSIGNRKKDYKLHALDLSN